MHQPAAQYVRWAVRVEQPADYGTIVNYSRNSQAAMDQEGAWNQKELGGRQGSNACQRPRGRHELREHQTLEGDRDQE